MFKRAAQNKLARMQNEGLTLDNVEAARQVGLFFGRIDERVFVIVEQAKVLIQSHINARRLNHPKVEGVQLDSSCLEFGANVTVTEEHELSLSRGLCIPLGFCVTEFHVDGRA